MFTACLNWWNYELSQNTTEERLIRNHHVFCVCCLMQGLFGVSGVSLQIRKALPAHTGVSEDVWRERARQVTITTEWLLNKGIWVFSPIVYGMQVDETCGSHDSAWWLRRDFEFFKKCGVFAILALDGWQDSPGVEKETEWALTMASQYLF